jgi:TetR/AcrR family tetracycline transcriptional repressor
MYSKLVANEESRGISEIPAKPRRGPRRSLDLPQVIDAALRVVDDGGPDALSVRAVAARLSVNPNALYTYVASRAALEREIVERVLGESDLARLERDDLSWRQRVLGYAISLRLELLRHPGVARLMMTAPMDGPTALLVGERLIGALVDGGLAPDDAARATYALIVQVLGSVALEVAETDGKPPLPPEPDRIAGRLAVLQWLDAAQWPMTATTTAVAAQWISTEQFTWSVERLLDGIAALRPQQ